MSKPEASMITRSFRNFHPSLLLAIFQWILAGCTTQPRMEVVELDNPREGTYQVYTVGNLVARKQRRDNTLDFEVFLNLQRIDWRYGERLFFVVVRYNGYDWLGIDSNRPLIVVVNQRRLQLASEGLGGGLRETVNEDGRPYRSEQARYEIDIEALELLAASQQARVLIPAQNRALELQLGRKNLDVFREFVAVYGHNSGKHRLK